VPRREPVFRKGVADASHCGGDLAGDFLVEGHHLGGALADVGGECLRLSLPFGSLHG
jgi:hypothetical protein